MHDPSIKNPAYEALTNQHIFLIDQLCDRFDRELAGGLGPRIESFLSETTEEARDGLLAELLAIEVEFRLSRGELATADDYQRRFPDHAELIEDAFDLARNPDAPTDSNSQFDERTVSVAPNDTAVSGAGTTAESRPTGDATSLVTQPFGRYTLQRLLGTGGMGSVYLAHDHELDRKVAIKFPEFDDRPDMKAAAIARFRREARAMATVHHPNICPIFDVGQHDGRHYLTMSYIDGKTLSEVFGSLSQEEVVRLVMTIARALHAAHQAGVVHRDLKPSNIMLNQRGEPIVMDFGLASRAAASEVEQTHSGLIIGSPAYMAPEQVDAAHDKIGPRTDVYALGVVLYELLSGRRPFDGAGLSVLGQIAVGVRPQSLSDIADVSPSLEAICLKAMAHRIGDRFQSTEELAESLEDWLQTRDAMPVAAAPSLRLTRWIVGGMLILAVGILLAIIVNSPDTFEQTDSRSVTVTSKGPPEPIPASEVVLDDGQPALLQAPFEKFQAMVRQQDWADYLGLPVEYTNSIGMKFRLIPPGEFLMGSTPEEIEAASISANPTWRENVKSEGPQHKVVLTKPIYVGMTEVTQAQFAQVMGATPSNFSATGEGAEEVANLETSNHPVEMVSWNDAAEFCERLSDREQLKPFYSRSDETVMSLESDSGYRLPTEAEWEYACRAGTTTRFWGGDEDQHLIQSGHFGSNSGWRTHAAGELKTNPFGLADVHGNVWEWVQDTWDPAFYMRFQEKPAIDPYSSYSSTGRRVARGGGWLTPLSDCRSSARGTDLPVARRNYIGFRVVLVPGVR